MWNLYRGPADHASSSTLLLIGECIINSVQAIASVEETQAPFSASELDTAERTARPAAARGSIPGPGAAAGMPAAPVEQEPARARGAVRRGRDRPAARGRAGRRAFLVLCLVSSATYLVNDVRDREQDRRHPRKRLRPVAAGELSPRAALRVAAVLALVGVACATAITPGLGVLALRLSRVDGELFAVVAAGGRARHPGDRRRFRAARARRRRRDRHLPVALVCDRDGMLRHLPGRRQALCRAARARRVRSRARATLRRYSPGHSASDARWRRPRSAGVAYAGWAFTRPAHLVWYGLSIAPFLLWLGRYAMPDRRGRRPGARRS